MTRAKLISALVFAGATWLLPRRALADVREAATRVEEEWRRAGAVVSRGQPRFLSEDETVAVTLAPAKESCTTLALVGARGMSFHAKVIDPPEDEERAEHAASIAGVLEIVRCDKDGESEGEIRRISVTSDAGRGAIETVVARSGGKLPPLEAVLPERTGGPLPPPLEPGGLPPLPPPEKRAEVAELRAERDGGRTSGKREAWVAGADGSGEGHVMLEAGCHRLELFAVDPRTSRSSRRFRLDLDAELRGEESETVLARDRTDAPDARLELCVGVATSGNVVFAGSPPNAPIVVSHSSWAIPERLPLTWGREVRARMAAAMLARHLSAPTSEAVFLAEGPSGMTPIPLTLEPGACYFAVVGIDHGHGRGIGLRAMVLARMTADDRSNSDEGALVSFCARDSDHARLEVDARGVGVAWALALFRVESGAWAGAR